MTHRRRRRGEALALRERDPGTRNAGMPRETSRFTRNKDVLVPRSARLQLYLCFGDRRGIFYCQVIARPKAPPYLRRAIVAIQAPK